MPCSIISFLCLTWLYSLPIIVQLVSTSVHVVSPWYVKTNDSNGTDARPDRHGDPVCCVHANLLASPRSLPTKTIPTHRHPHARRRARKWRAHATVPVLVQGYCRREDDAVVSFTYRNVSSSLGLCCNGCWGGIHLYFMCSHGPAPNIVAGGSGIPWEFFKPATVTLFCALSRPLHCGWGWGHFQRLGRLSW
jgi:hypothetical protein